MALAWKIQTVSNPHRILKTLDSHLAAQNEITLFGRAALALGYGQSPDQFHSTQDVDGILPVAWLDPRNNQEDFWRAVQRTNLDFESEGLYLTHLFREVDVIIQSDWVNNRVSLDLGFSKLSVFRPATIDLVLTKMARGDDDDLRDIQFLLRQEATTQAILSRAFQKARVPAIPEIQELFDRAKPKVLAMART